MRCPACNAENERETGRCVGCGAALARRPRRSRAVPDDSDTPFSGPFEAANLPALRAYWVGLLGMIPFVGLVLGPAALGLWLWAKRKSRGNARFTAHSPLLAALLLGAWYLYSTIRFAGILRDPEAPENRALARQLLKVSVIYLPLLLLAMMLNAQGRLLFQ